MQMLSGDWVTAVLTALALGPLHFTRVLAEVNQVEETVRRRMHEHPLSGKVLARTLRRMQRDGLVRRHDETVSHPSVRYELTPTGEALLVALRPVAEWVEDYHVWRLPDSPGIV